ncbi:MAG: AMP-binding protein [Phycisphaerales bacterium]|nr:AMP-binding protein [Phycisphaerales bacterium]
MLVEMLLQTAKEHALAPAVADASIRLTYKRLVGLSRIIREYVIDNTNRERVGVILPASALFSGCMFGVWWAKRTMVPLNFLLAADELRPLAQRAELDLIVSISHFKPLCEELGIRALYLDELPLKRRFAMLALKRTPPVPKVDPDETAVLLFTSGTSAQPKGVELSYRNLRSNAEDMVASAEITPGHRLLNCLPPFHVFGLTTSALVPIAAGASSYCIPRFSPVAISKAIQEEDISVFMAIPSMHGALLRLKSAPDDLFKNVFLLGSGGEPLAENIFAGYKKRFNARLLQGYGLTETSPVCTLELPHRQRDGSIGKPIRNVQIRIVDENGADVPQGHEGEIWIKGPNVMKGYRDDPESTANVLTSDGWFRSGDAGKIDDDGFVYITGRIKEMLIVAGENVHPREIESVLEQHPAVAEAGVIGMTDPSRGEVPAAFVTLEEGASATEVELRDHARKSLAGFKVPKQIRILDELPHGATGKLLRRKLVDLL